MAENKGDDALDLISQAVDSIEQKENFEVDKIGVLGEIDVIRAQCVRLSAYIDGLAWSPLRPKQDDERTLAEIKAWANLAESRLKMSVLSQS